jgi:hypothetical protein
METRVQLISVILAAGLLVVIIELVRRRRLLERYALLWILSAVVLLAIAAWSGLLTGLAEAVGIAYPPSALFLVALGFILLLLLHFSVAISRVSEQAKVLAQRLALVEDRLRETEEALAKTRNGDAPAEDAHVSIEEVTGPDGTPADEPVPDASARSELVER